MKKGQRYRKIYTEEDLVSCPFSDNLTYTVNGMLFWVGFFMDDPFIVKALHVFGFFVLFLFSYTVSSQLWARLSDSEAARIIRFPAFCLWHWEIPILTIGGALVISFGSLITLYIGVIYLGCYFTLFVIDRYTGYWVYHTPRTYAREIKRIRQELREYKERQNKG